MSKDYYTFAELRLTLDNPDKGCPTNMYRAIVTAQELGIIGNDTDWDVGLTKAEAIRLYIDTLQAYTAENGYPIDAVGGQGSDEIIVKTTITDDNADTDNLGVDGEFGDGEYNELDETDETAIVTTDETGIDVTAKVAEAMGDKTVIIDGEVYIDLTGDDDGYVPPTGDTTPLPPELGPNGSGEDATGPRFPDVYVPDGTFIQ